MHAGSAASALVMTGRVVVGPVSAPTPVRDRFRAMAGLDASSPEGQRRIGSFVAIGWVIHTVVGWDWTEFERIDALQATYVVAVLGRIRPPLMVRVDPALGAVEMFRGPRVELIHPQRVLPLKNADTG
jgi:hypothetical protein